MAKTVNFGVLYGMSAMLAREQGINNAEAQAFMSASSAASACRAVED